MAYTPKVNNFVGKIVRLTEVKDSIAGSFSIGTIVTITDYDPARGYTFLDDYGNQIIEAGFNGFEVLS